MAVANLAKGKDSKATIQIQYRPCLVSNDAEFYTYAHTLVKAWNKMHLKGVCSKMSKFWDF